jgi:hypothetical protein
MDKGQMKVAGIACLIICLICLFVAVERYQANANAVHAANAMNSAFGHGFFQGMTGDMTPATPTATLYAGFFALLSGIGGVVLLMKSSSKN